MPSVTLEAALIFALTLVISVAAFTQVQTTLSLTPRICEWNALSQINTALEAALLTPLSRQSVAVPFSQTISVRNHEIRLSGCDQTQPDIVDPLHLVAQYNSTTIVYADSFNMTQTIIACPATIMIQYFPFNQTLSFW
jgi:hypothetical protein